MIPVDGVDPFTFDIITSHPTTSAAMDADSTPTFAVFEGANDTPILAAQSFTKRTDLTGNYRGSITVSTGNGFEAGKWYSVVASATVNGISGKAALGSFRCGVAETTAGIPQVNSTALAAAIDAVDNFLDTEMAAVLAAVDTEVAAINVKTASLTFGVAGSVNANIKHVNDVTLNGDGTVTPWGP